MGKRLYFIDNLRGFLIILVIIGHCIQYMDIDYDHNIIFRYIYSFHMPLFMFVSGYVSYKHDYRWSLIKRRAIQLIVPFISWAMIGMTISGSYDMKFLTHPDTALWFLWVLFWIGTVHMSLSKCCRRFNLNEEIVFSVSCFLFLAILLFSKLSFGFHLFAWYLPFYVFGAFLRKHDSLFSDIMDRCRLPLGAFFVILAFFWMRNESPTFMSSQSQVIIFGYKFIVGLIGSLFFMSVARMFDGKLLLISEIGGGMTLGIYAIHQYIIRSTSFLDMDKTAYNTFCGISISFVLVLIITLIAYYLLSRFRFTSRLFLGK